MTNWENLRGTRLVVNVGSSPLGETEKQRAQRGNARWVILIQGDPETVKFKKKLKVGRGHKKPPAGSQQVDI